MREEFWLGAKQVRIIFGCGAILGIAIDLLLWS